MSTEPSRGDAGPALLAFDEEAVPYCQGISDADAREYAMDYARMLRNRAKGLEFEEQTRFSPRLFGPNRNLIKATLDRIYRKYLPAQDRPNSERRRYS